MTKDSSRPARNCRRRIWRPRGGRWPGRRIFSKQVVPASLRSATSGAATSSASLRPSARDQLRLPSSIRYFTSKGLSATDLGATLVNWTDEARDPGASIEADDVAQEHQPWTNMSG